MDLEHTTGERPSFEVHTPERQRMTDFVLVLCLQKLWRDS